MKNKKIFYSIKKRVKTFAVLLFVAMLCPVLFLSGCANQRTITFATMQTELNVMNFYNTIKTQQKNFIKYVDDEYEDDFENLETEEQNQYSSSVSLIQDLLNKIYVVMPVLDCYLTDDPEKSNEKGQYNLTDEDLEIGYYEIIEKATAGNLKSYYKKLSGSDASTYLPATIISGNTALTDSIDDTIKTWGNYLNFDVLYSSVNKTYTITATGEFGYPDDVEERNVDGIKIKRYNDTKKIAIVYTENAVLYSKVVEFITGTTGTTKKVTKYTGDYTINSASQVGTYDYVFEQAPTGVTGKYEIKFVSETGYINVKYTKDPQASGNYHILECYALSEDIMITRFHKIVGVKTEVYDLCVSGGVNGKFKKYENSQVVRIEDITKITAGEFAVITNSDRADTAHKKIAFLIDKNGLTCENVGY